MIVGCERWSIWNEKVMSYFRIPMSPTETKEKREQVQWSYLINLWFEPRPFHKMSGVLWLQIMLNLRIKHWMLMLILSFAFHSLFSEKKQISHKHYRLHIVLKVFKKTPWSEFASEPYRPSDRRLSAKWLSTFADRRCHVVSVTDPYGRILGFLDSSRYFSIK
jgi:hypothetical protein